VLLGCAQSSLQNAKKTWKISHGVLFKDTMRKLHYHSLCAFSRTAQFALSEKKLDFSIEVTKFWDKNSGLCELNSFGRLPVLIELNGTVISGVYAVIEYLEEKYEESHILSPDANERAEARRIFQWVNEDFSAEVTSVLAFEKGLKRFFVSQGEQSAPSSAVLKQVRETFNKYVKKIEWFIDRRRWLAGDSFSIADIAVAAHFSIIDYMGSISWEYYPIAKEWYARIKSRPSFKKVLNERIPGIAPVSYYTDPDF
jgi:glutathione S-transferase